MSKYNIDIYAVAITTNIENGGVYVLSLDETKIVFPYLEINSTNVESIDNSMVDLMRRFLMTSSIELIPQIITLNSNIIKSRKHHSMNVVYGFLIKEGIKHFDSHWLSFDFQNPNTEYSPLIFEVVQKLK